MMLRPFLLTATIGLALALGPPGAAQVPDLGGAVGGAIGGVGNTVGGATDALRDTLTETRGAVDDLGERTMRELRRARSDELDLLRRRHPERFDLDRDGALVLQHEVLALDPTPAALSAAQARGFSVGGEQETLGVRIVTLRAPEGMSTRRAIEILREADPAGSYEYNHVYLGAGSAAPERRSAVQANERGGGNGVRVGLIDSGVDAHHPALRNAAIHQRGFAGRQAIADTHGTAIASLLVGRDADFHGAAAGAELYVADVYGDLPGGGGAAAIVAAMGWMAEQRATVINVSLVGPANRALEAGVRALIARGHIVVAAVGNDGPNAPPLYPAAYAGVIGVTGVDSRNRALPEAARGAQVDFAAPGSDMAAAAPGGGYARVRGTSYAAPLVAGLLARRVTALDPASAQQAERALSRDAQDLGTRGADRVFGAGLVGADLRIAPRAVAAR